MKRWVPLLTLSLAACSQRPPTVEECKALAVPGRVVERCYGGNLKNGRYVGDLKCWPFSRAQRLRGLWLITMEESAFYPNARALGDVNSRRARVWLQSDLVNKRPELLASAQGASTRIYAVDLEGRLSLCDGMFGHFGMFPREVVAERFHSMRLLRLLPNVP